MNLKLLAEPFPPGDIAWRVSRSGVNTSGSVYCNVLAYITARAIANRLDEVCGPENWSNTPQTVTEVRAGLYSIQVGISIWVGDRWVTKHDVSDVTEIEPVKGGFSGAMKRAGSQWGIGRYLRLLTEQKTEVSDKWVKGWKHARTPRDQGSREFWWEPPSLPSWALPRESASDRPVTPEELTKLKLAWAAKFAPAEKSKQVKADSFRQFVFAITGEFPLDDPERWTHNSLNDVQERITTTTNINGPSPDVPFK